jgi:hypothetical protein
MVCMMVYVLSDHYWGINMSNISKIIFQQIRGIDPLSFFAWGAKDFVYMYDGLKFKTSGMVKRKCFVYIRYHHGLDLYEIMFARIRKHEWIVDHRDTNVYFEDLVKMIDNYVG